AKGVFGLAEAPLQRLGIGCDVRITPAAVAELCRGVEVVALAAIVDVAIDRGGAAEGLAARRVDAAPAGPRTRLLLVGPVDALHVKGLDEAGRQMDVGMPVARPGLEHADAGRKIFAQPVGEHTAGRARAHDDVIKGVHDIPWLSAGPRFASTSARASSHQIMRLEDLILRSRAFFARRLEG